MFNHPDLQLFGLNMGHPILRRGSDTQLQVDANLNDLTNRFKCLFTVSYCHLKRLTLSNH